jgi:N-acetylmuramoyl-L-alanine amidase
MTGQGLEKTLTVELANAVRRILNKSPKLRVTVLRERDQALTLDERAALANTAGASVFISIHAAPGSAARVYIQDVAEESEATAARAQSVSGDFLGYESGSEQQELAWGRQQAAHAQQSGWLGKKLARQLAGRDDAEPAQAPLAGLRAVDAAAVLVEVGMAQDRARAAEDIARGVEQYVLDAR